jgi:hypothetical protein
MILWSVGGVVAYIANQMPPITKRNPFLQIQGREIGSVPVLMGTHYVCTSGVMTHSR